MTKISATVVADSVNIHGDRLTSVLVTMPRIIIAEMNTHRMLSKNTSSSRAIPFNKMVEAVKNNPFIPIAWQKEHKGMQGSEYYSKEEKFNLTTFVGAMINTLNNLEKGTKEYNDLQKEIEEKTNLIESILIPYKFETKTLDEWWLLARNKAIETACILYVFKTTKQLCNRLLEPFMWTTMLITGSKSGWNNFLKLRCPSYTFHTDKSENDFIFKSKKHAIKHFPKDEVVEYETGNVLLKDLTDLQWLQVNQGQAEIHFMALCEKIYDAVQESKPKSLQEGDWHIPMIEVIEDQL
jgi:hypothetical protein